MITINADLVKKLIKEQFPQWSNLDIKPVKNGGNDNRTFHLGEELSVRLPSEEAYSYQVEKEQKWLPILAEKLSFTIPTPIAKGVANEDYPWSWSIYKWLEGETLSYKKIDGLSQFAKDLGTFLNEFQAIDASEGPLAGQHNFYRGGSLLIYDKESRNSIENNKNSFDLHILNEIWDLALDSKWVSNPVWVHGDIAPGNILVKDGKLSAVIDFGILGVGDPSCDAAIAWTFFDETSRGEFKKVLNIDGGTWNRARGWALWKALITYDAYKDTVKIMADEAYRTILTIIDDYKLNKL